MDELGGDSNVAATFQVTERTTNASSVTAPQTTRINAPASTSNTPGVPRVQQPKPQALPSRSGPTSILVSPRQKGNPILNSVRSVAWEYSDIAADYVLGATTCALFLSLKYHRLHPEYIYNRIRDLKGQYNLRILLTMVDIDNHEESLRELSKTSLINHVTLMLCWSAQEAGRYLELFKTYEHAAPTSIRAPQSTGYSDKLVEFITVPRSINKTDAVGLVSNFGSIRTAVNARPEEVALIAGWGEKKVQRWCGTVREPFRIKKAAKRGVNSGGNRAEMSSQMLGAHGEPDPRVAARLGIGAPVRVGTELPRPSSASAMGADAESRPSIRATEDIPMWTPNEDEEEAMREIANETQSSRTIQVKPSTSNDGSTRRKHADDEMSEGVMAALAKLRQQN